MKKIRYFLLFIFVLIIPEWLIELTSADIFVIRELRDLKKMEREKKCLIL